MCAEMPVFRKFPEFRKFFTVCHVQKKKKKKKKAVYQFSGDFISFHEILTTVTGIPVCATSYMHAGIARKNQPHTLSACAVHASIQLHALSANICMQKLCTASNLHSLCAEAACTLIGMQKQ